jgi:hypothetical protein
MPLDDTTPLFFDASCLVAASGSPNGGSGFLLLVCRQGQLTVVVSQPVLLEAARNVAENMGVQRLLSLQRQVSLEPQACLVDNCQSSIRCKPTEPANRTASHSNISFPITAVHLNKSIHVGRSILITRERCTRHN